MLLIKWQYILVSSESMFDAELSNEKTIGADLDTTLVNETESVAINVVRNLKLVFQFCELFQNDRDPFPHRTNARRKKIRFLEIEDFLYPNPITKQAVILFIAELFHIFCDQIVPKESRGNQDGQDRNPKFDVPDPEETPPMNGEQNSLCNS